MSSFEGLKRDFGSRNDKDDQELGPITLDLPESEFYDPDDRTVKLS